MPIANITDYKNNIMPSTPLLTLRIMHYLTGFLFVLGIVSVGTTFLSVLDIISTSAVFIRTSLAANVVSFIGLAGILGLRINMLRKESMHGTAGASLHTRLAVFCLLIAGVPAFLVAGFAAFTLEQGLDSWFSNRTKAILADVASVADIYLVEKHENLRRESIAMAMSLSRQATLYKQAPLQFRNYFEAQAEYRNITQVMLLRKDGMIVMATILPPENRGAENEVGALRLNVPPREMFARAETSEAVFFKDSKFEQVRVLVALQGFDNLFLYATREVSAAIVRHIQTADAALHDYSGFEANRFDKQMQFASFYLVLATFILLSAVWVGFYVADKLSRPISHLIEAAQRLGDGDLQTRVDIGDTQSTDLAQLSETFNTMAARLNTQQAELLAAHDDLDKRAAFTEMVLSGVSSGVVGVDATGTINHVNAEACMLYDAEAGDIIGKKIATVMPEFMPLVAAMTDSSEGKSMQITKIDKAKNTHDLATSINSSADASGAHATLVITFDDITPLLAAQRNAAWADIARRIAHEIKNPLTPIQLSAERLQSKYGNLESINREVFRQCTGTIISQVEDIGRMVSSFADFARMPALVVRSFNIADIIKQAVFSQSTAYGYIAYEFDNDSEAGQAVMIEGDAPQISQALANALKNSAESINQNRDESDSLSANPMRPKKRIKVVLKSMEDDVSIRISDSGIGWPRENRQALLEPYSGLRSQGSGLGLSILKKIIDDHAGVLALEDDAELGGAALVINLPRRHATTTSPS